ncbi:MAG: NrdH-redoxin [Bifidobacteriaceae bacterium]|jgi:glutaredoxin-like protein NrdH|nr:NrdH-redoxin [Bifidobacteriaceae bacterium]
MVNLYSIPMCPQCDATKKEFKKNGISYNEISLQDVPEKIDEFADAGFMSAPIVVTDDQTWAGFRPDLIQGIAKTTTVAAPAFA